MAKLHLTQFSERVHICFDAFLIRFHCRPQKQFALTFDKLQINYNFKINFLNLTDAVSDTLLYMQNGQYDILIPMHF